MKFGGGLERLALVMAAGSLMACGADGSFGELEQPTEEQVEKTTQAVVAGGPLIYAAPSLAAGYATVNVPISGSAGNCQPVASGPSNQDLLLVLPPNNSTTGPVEVVGYRNIIVRGGKIRPDKTLYKTCRKNFMLQFTDKPAGQIFIEGIEIDGGNYVQADAVRLTNAYGDPMVVIQTSRFINLHGAWDESQGALYDGVFAYNNHSDVFQVASGRIGGLRVDRVTASSDYQGFLMAVGVNENQTQLPGATWRFRRTNIYAQTNEVDGGTPNIYYFLQQSDYTGPKRNVLLEDSGGAGSVYAKGLGGNIAVDHVHPMNISASQNAGRCWDQGGTYCRFNDSSMGGSPGQTTYYSNFVVGKLMYQPGSFTDYVPSGQAGLGYVSP